MDVARKEYLVNRIVSGTIRLKLGDSTFFVATPDPEIKYVASDLYNNAYEEALDEGLYTEDDLYDFLLDQKLWDDKDEDSLSVWEKDIEEFKTKLCLIKFQTNEKIRIKKLLKVAKDEHSKLLNRKHGYDFLSCEGFATVVKNRYLLGMSILDQSKRRLYKSDNDYFNDTGTIVFSMIDQLAEHRITEDEYRELARTDPWRSFWSLKKIGHIFSKPVMHFSDEQKNLSMWSCLYDNILESPDCPADEIYNDNDALDGWLILQRRKRDQELNQKAFDDTLGKNKDAQEVFIKADTLEDAKKIEKFNSPTSRAIKRRRMELLKKKGEVKEADFPDVQQDLQLLKNQAYIASAKNR